ncbi:MAG TPA: double zinc ribbon domain-containing protein [Gemmatimonadaceae bacterium]|nr:double zinc ribbon domain-containing protein [Gemmatimonadaceae bacterium]
MSLSGVRRRCTTIATALLELALPGVCALCSAALGRQTGPACQLCWSRISRLQHPQCPRCGHPPSQLAEPGDPCRWCDALPPFVRCVRSVAWMSRRGVASQLVHAFKYDGWPRIGDRMAEEMTRLRWPADVVRERTCLVPVPLASWRQRERGYNQAAVLANALAAHWSLPVQAVLARTRMPASQTRLTPGERSVNVSRAFTVVSAGAPQLQGAHCVLVDDVVTTAATLVACAAALMDGGARIVSCVTFGRAPAIGDRRSPLE